MRPGRKSGKGRAVSRIVASAAAVAMAVLIGASLYGGGPMMRLADIFWTFPSH
jgi:hypothetical protein